MILGLIRLSLHQATDLVEEPDRAPGWTYTNTAILDGYGKGSSMIPGLIASAHPDLADVTSFLDVGTGVGLLAVAAANVWGAEALNVSVLESVAAMILLVAALTAWGPARRAMRVDPILVLRAE